MIAFTESDVERAALAWLENVGWSVKHGVEIACRGELRDGDHAEYTLLERKNRHCKLDGAVLLTTVDRKGIRFLQETCAAVAKRVRPGTRFSEHDRDRGPDTVSR